ncbi:MAG: phenylalanine--tRNA ligase subunit beta [Rickettsia sp.]|nr:phenylalanine--tRNA ligase subunit beta [Rickettsia sp.]
MKITLSSLEEFIEYDRSFVSPDAISKTLNQLGVENEILEDYEYLENFVIGKITSVIPHPLANSLKICVVDTGSSSLQIICGANNVRANLNIVLAQIGTKIPLTGKKIKKSKIRDHLSEGMICSYSELKLDKLQNNTDEIIEIDANALVGDKILKYIKLDYSFNIEVTPNRGEILSVYGLAKELSSSGIVKMKPISSYIEDSDKNFTSRLTIKNEKNICPVFSARELSNINNQVELPLWLREELFKADINSVSPLVDIANYTTYKFGQPLHIYDQEKIGLEILVEELSENDVKFDALNGENYILQKGDIIVKNSSHKILALAGIIGSEDTACSINTKNIIVEAALFNSTRITKTCNRLDLQTDAKHRFEKNINFDLLTIALDYAANLILDICGGKTSNLKINSYIQDKKREILFSKNKFLKHSGVVISQEEIENILNNLDFTFQNISEDLTKIYVPIWRKDLTIQEDINEEILRIYGYDNIGFTSIPNDKLIFLEKDEQLIIEIKRILTFRGYLESISYSFVDKRNISDFFDVYEELEIVNPISNEINYMRPSLLVNYLPIIEKNINKSWKNFSIFEIGKIFQGSQREEIQKIFLLRVGLNNQTDYFQKERKFDLFDIKTDFKIILDHLNIDDNQIKYENQYLPKYMKNNEAFVVKTTQGQSLGYLGKISNELSVKYNIQGSNIFCMELDLMKLIKLSKSLKRDPYNNMSYQPVTREYNFVLNKKIALGEVIKFLYNIDSKFIQKIRLIDIHEETAETNAVTFSITLQDLNNNLSEEKLKKLQNNIISKTEKQFLCIIKDYKNSL